VHSLEQTCFPLCYPKIPSTSIGKILEHYISPIWGPFGAARMPFLAHVHDGARIRSIGISYHYVVGILQTDSENHMRVVWRHPWLCDHTIFAYQLARIRAVTFGNKEVLPNTKENATVRRKACIASFEVAETARFSCR
jgi:hypothetical protein